MQGRMSVALITIGQSPRTDVVPGIRAALPEHVDIVERGVLDGLGSAEIAARSPVTRGATLVSRLKDGTEVEIDKLFVHERVGELVESLTDEASIIALLCSATFEGLRSCRPLVLPDKLLRGFLNAVSLPAPVGVLVPSPHQIEPLSEDFRSWNVPAVFASVSPYEPADDIERVVQEVVEQGVAAIVLDCFGYGPRARHIARSASGLPVVSVLSLLTGALRELLDVEPC